jgi:hypothetical protein
VPVLVRQKSAPSTESFFDVYLKRDERYDDGRAMFVREGIIISDVRAPRTRKVRAIVVAEHDALANLLGDSENPAHTQWQKDSSNYKGKYVYGPSYIEFVSESASKLVKFMTEDDNEQNLVLAREFFSLRDAEAPPIGETAPVTRPGSRTPRPRPPALTRRPRLLRIAQVAGGFVLRPGDTGTDATGREFTIRVAFDVRRGNAFSKYAPEDFELLKGDIKPAVQEGLDVLDAEHNVLRVRITAPDFTFRLTGFDENRDLVVQAREVRNEAQP